MARSSHNFIDLTNQQFGDLTALSYNKGTKQKHSTWTCICSCGKQINVPGYALRAGTYKSCGCKRISRRDDGVKKHIERDSVNGTRITSLKAKGHKDSKSGVKGVYWVKSRNKWLVRIMVAGKNHHIGYFEDKAAAVEARKKAEEIYHKPLLEDKNNDN